MLPLEVTICSVCGVNNSLSLKFNTFIWFCFWLWCFLHFKETFTNSSLNADSFVLFVLVGASHSGNVSCPLYTVVSLSFTNDLPWLFSLCHQSDSKLYLLFNHFYFISFIILSFVSITCFYNSAMSHLNRSFCVIEFLEIIFCFSGYIFFQTEMFFCFFHAVLPYFFLSLCSE